MGQRRSSFIAASLVVLASAALSRAFFVAFAPFWAGDSYEYDAIARNLLAGEGYSLIAGAPTVFRPPGYPLFVATVYAISGESAGAVLAAQVAVGAVATWIVYVAARRVVDERSAVSGAILAGLYPHISFYAATVLSETLAFLFVSVGLLAATYLQGARRPLLAATVCGAALALAGLTSPRLAALPVAILAVVGLHRVPVAHLLRLTAAMALGYALVLAPWVIRNVAVFGRPIPATVGQSGLNLWLSAYRVTPYDYRLAEMARSEPLVGRWLELYEGPGKPLERERFPERLKLEDELTRDALGRIASDPLGYVIHRLWVLPALWVQPAAYAGNFREPFGPQNYQLQSMVEQRRWPSVVIRLIAIAVFTVGLFAGVALGIWRWRREPMRIALLLAPAIYVLAVHSMLLAEQRYSVLSHPFLWVVAAGGWVYASSVVAIRLTRNDRGSAIR